jgi:malate dehydrogenase (oxaloacetate-decarboxylating)(NADP+)
VYAALRLLPLPTLAGQTVLFFGAGEAGIGIADLMVSAMISEGLTEDEARGRCWFVDSRGLVVQSRDDLADHKRPYAHPPAPVPDLLSAIGTLKPSVLIGVSGQPQTFTRPVIEAMTALNERPVILALSNPTSKSECTAEQAYAWSHGRAVFASGSPFPAVEYDGRRFDPAQANNAYAFPGLALGVIASEARRVTEAMFLTAARTLAATVTEQDLSHGRIFPPLHQIREISVSIAVAVARLSYATGLASFAPPPDLEVAVRTLMYDPHYQDNL